MIHLAVRLVAYAAMFTAAVAAAQQPAELPQVPDMPAPTKEHQWLAQLVGQWESESEMSMPGLPQMTCTGTETIKPFGEFWIVAESQATMMGIPVATLLTLGYDPAKEKFVGTWIDSNTSYLWHYVGTLEPNGKVLTLHTEGPDVTDLTKTAKYKEELEIVSPDEKLFRSSIQNADGSWTTFVTAKYRRATK